MRGDGRVSFKKMLGVILIVVVALFGLMLTTSYAWYSYESASTKFDVVTANDDIDIVFQKGEFINTESAIPLKVSDIDRYSDKYDFNIKIKKYVEDNEMVAKVSLVDIVMDEELKKVDEVLGDSPFRIELFYQGGLVGSSISGKDIVDTVYEFGDVVLSSSIDNQFELRVYLVDNDGKQDYLMDKKFQGKINVSVISRVSTNAVTFENPDISVSKITIDGIESKSLPTSNLYDMTAVCEKGSNVTWNTMTKSLIYGKGSFVGDSCSLSFVKSTKKVYLREATVGSYVQYVGNNGCSGKACSGENANYVDDNQMGYCGNEDFHYFKSGFRIAYIKDNTAYLVSAGAPECGNLQSIEDIAIKYCNTNYTYQGVCDSNSVWSLRSSDISNINSDLINIGGYYWYSNSSDVSFWNPSNRTFLTNNDSGDYGVRPVIRLDADVYIVGGAGTYQDPYIIQK